MISSQDFYHVMTATVPLYVAMLLAYASVRWWRVFTPEQCAGINRFVALFAVPLLSFHFISLNNPFAMSLRFLAADTLQKLIVLAALAAWAALGRGTLDRTVTLFSLATLPNTLVMGIPLLRGMYGDFSAALMVQVVVLQCIVWYTFIIFMLEYRGARILVAEQFPAGAISSVAVDADVTSLDGRGLEAEAEAVGDGTVRVVVRRSDVCSRRVSGLTNAEIYSLRSTPRGSSFGCGDVGPPRGEGLDEEGGGAGRARAQFQTAGAAAAAKRDLHMFLWSSTESPVSEAFGGGGKEVRLNLSPPRGKCVKIGKRRLNLKYQKIKLDCEI